MKKIQILFVLLMISCASSGPVSIGKDTYMISKQSSTGFHSGSSVKAEIYKEASEYCAKKQMELQPVRESSKDGIPGYAFANAEIVFRCLKEGDSELNRPNMKKESDLVIEKR